MNNPNLLPFAIKIAKEAGSILIKHFGKINSTKSKSSNIDLVTIADTQSEKFITNEIHSKYPNHNIIAEEGYINNNDSDYCWIIDPLDGTTNFVHNLPIFAVSIGLQYKNETIIGVVYNPAVDKCFYASKNNKAMLNDQEIKISSTNTLSKSLLVTGFPYTHDCSYDRLFILFKEFYDISQGVRRLGAASLDLCFVAMGRFEGFWESGLQPWDICAGALILKEAGGTFSDWEGNEISTEGTNILATNSHIHDDMLDIIKKSN